MRLFALVVCVLPCLRAAGLSIHETRADLPACAQVCASRTTIGTSCSPEVPSALPSCICSDRSIQSAFSVCIQADCEYPDQTIAIRLYQRSCSGFPVESKSSYMQSVAIAFLAITIPLIFLRLYCRLIVIQHTGWDDGAFILASILSVSTTIFIFPLSDLGFGLHLWDVRIDNIVPIGILFYIGQLQYVYVQILTKVAFLLFYLRVFPNKTVRIGSYLSLAFLGGKFLVFLFVVVFQCTPVVSIWDRSVPGTCVNFRLLTYMAGGLSVFEDLVILVLPVPAIRALNMPRSQKFTAIGMFTLGSLACIASAVRIKHLEDLENGPHGTDTTWNNVDAYVWSVIENSLALICASLAAIKPMLSLFVPRIVGVFSKTSQTSTHPSLATSRHASQSWRWKDLPSLPISNLEADRRRATENSAV